MLPWLIGFFVLILVGVLLWNLRRPTGIVMAPRRVSRGLPELAEFLKVDLAELQGFQPQYRRVEIPKKRRGTRILQVPDPTTKAWQRKIARRLLAPLAAHPAACGYERGKSIADNARPHLQSRVVIRLDVIDFFPQTSSRRVEELFLRLGWNREATAWLVQACTWQGGLPQGACTSPRLSNLVNRGLDSRLAGAAQALGARYTRYADDLTFSFPLSCPDDAELKRNIRRIQRRAERIARGFGYRLHQRRKRFIRRRHQQQLVTGVVVNQKLALPRAQRRRLRAVAHHLAHQQPATLTAEQFAGWQALEQMLQQPTK